MDISIAEAHNRLSALLKKVDQGPIVITRRGVTVGVIISPDEYARLRKVQAYLHMIELSKTLRASGVSAAELYQVSRQELEDRR